MNQAPIISLARLSQTATRITSGGNVVYRSLSRSVSLAQQVTSSRVHASSTRAFTTGALLQKKGNKAARSEARSDDSASATSNTSSAASDDPFDFSELEAGITKAHEKLKDDLSKLRAGGRFNPELVENLRVSLVNKDKDSGKQSVRLGDVAQVVPRGRVLGVMVGEKDHIKPVSSAIQSSELSLTPQPDAQNPLQLNINLPPPTTESRQKAVQAAGKAADNANTAIRNARGSQQKKLRAMQTGKGAAKARPDDLKKATDRMEKVVEKGSAEVKRIVDAAKKTLES